MEQHTQELEKQCKALSRVMLCTLYTQRCVYVHTLPRINDFASKFTAHSKYLIIIGWRSACNAVMFFFSYLIACLLVFAKDHTAESIWMIIMVITFLMTICYFLWRSTVRLPYYCKTQFQYKDTVALWDESVPSCRGFSIQMVPCMLLAWDSWWPKRWNTVILKKQLNFPIMSG